MFEKISKFREENVWAFSLLHVCAYLDSTVAIPKVFLAGWADCFFDGVEGRFDESLKALKECRLLEERSEGWVFVETHVQAETRRQLEADQAAGSLLKTFLSSLCVAFNKQLSGGLDEKEMLTRVRKLSAHMESVITHHKRLFKDNEGGDPELLATLYCHVSSAHMRDPAVSGNLKKAQLYLEGALALLEAARVEDKKLVPVLTALGRVCLALGEDKQGEDFLWLSSLLKEESPNMGGPS